MACSASSIGLARRGEQGKVGRRPLQQKVEFALGQIAVAGHERQLGIDLPDEQKVALPARARRQQIEREVRVAAQAQARLAAALARLATSCATTFTPRSST